MLGLTSDATEAQIKKAYRKIAMAIHPDKNKSVSAAELFKLVSHAQSVLIDKEQRQSYNRKLITKGLHTYVPKRTKLTALVAAANSVGEKTPDSSPRKDAHRPASATAAHPTQSKPAPPTDTRPRTSFSRKSKPYEQQPYGFGFDVDSSSAPSPNRNKHFKAKSYQHQRPTEEKVKESKLGSSTYSSRFPSSAPEHGGTQGEHEGPSTPYSDGKRTRLHKTTKQELNVDPPTSPFPTNYHRHYARTNHHDKQQNKRSTSPVKSQPNSTKDTLQGLKDIMDQFKSATDDQDSSTEVPQNPESENHPQESVVEPKKGQKAGSSLKFKPNLTADDHAAQNTVPRKRPIVTATKSETIHTTTTGDIKLTELESVLPRDNEFFDMRQVSSTLDDVKIKRPKLETSPSPEVDMIESPRQNSAFPYENVAEILSRPVNETLPRIYKPEAVSLSELGIEESVATLQLPDLPILQINVMDKREVLQTVQKIKEFNVHANKLKKKLLEVLSRRSTADDLFTDRLTRVENINMLLQAKNFDLEVSQKIHELQNRQRVVAESFATLMRSVYASTKQ